MGGPPGIPGHGQSAASVHQGCPLRQAQGEAKPQGTELYEDANHEIPQEAKLFTPGVTNRNVPAVIFKRGLFNRSKGNFFAMPKD